MFLNKSLEYMYRGSPHRASSHSTDFSIVRFLKNIHSSHSTSINFSIVLFWDIFLYYILIVRISHSTVFWCSTLTVLWGDPLYIIQPTILMKIISLGNKASIHLCYVISIQFLHNENFCDLKKTGQNGKI